MMHYNYYYQAATATSTPSGRHVPSECWSKWGVKKYVAGQHQQSIGVTSSSSSSSSETMEKMIVRLASENAVVIFSSTSCCMCHAVKSLLCGMGVNPTVYELDQLVDPALSKHIERALLRIMGQSIRTSNATTGVVGPVVFVGGKLLGPMDRVMASHINGSLVPLLKQAGALWL